MAPPTPVSAWSMVIGLWRCIELINSRVYVQQRVRVVVEYGCLSVPRLISETASRTITKL